MLSQQEIYCGKKLILPGLEKKNAYLLPNTEMQTSDESYFSSKVTYNVRPYCLTMRFMQNLCVRIKENTVLGRFCTSDGFKILVWVHRK